ncbi:MAG TPA: LysR family transcriptional regulator [Gammaproteobacteria bacterium]|nr:LysR family transcriptional regulator [Gammaproteobacteria bacterium]
MNAQSIAWDDFRTVLAVCREGTLSGAARLLEVNHSTVFRRINALEEKLGVRLFERLPEGYAMTEAGESVREAGERIEDEVLGLSRKLVGRDLGLHGTLRVTAPDAFAIKLLTPLLVQFSHQYPGIQLELSMANHYLDLTRREADVAIRATMTPPESAIGRRLCALVTTVYGASPYLEAKQADQALEQYAWLMPDDDLAQLPFARWLNKHFSVASVVYRSNSLLGLFEAAKRGMGIAPLPCFLGDPESGLQRLIEPPEALASELWLLSHPDLRRTARVRALMDFLSEAIDAERALLEGRGFV